MIFNKNSKFFYQFTLLPYLPTLPTYLHYLPTLHTYLLYLPTLPTYLLYLPAVPTYSTLPTYSTYLEWYFTLQSKYHLRPYSQAKAFDEYKNPHKVMSWGIGCVTIGWAVASDTRGPRFESSRMLFFIYCKNPKIKKKEALVRTKSLIKMNNFSWMILYWTKLGYFIPRNRCQSGSWIQFTQYDLLRYLHRSLYITVSIF